MKKLLLVLLLPLGCTCLYGQINALNFPTSTNNSITITPLGVNTGLGSTKRNTYLGEGLSNDNTLGDFNTGIGVAASGAMYGTGNTAIGTGALNSMRSSGLGNVALGYLAGAYLAGGNGNIFIGFGADFGRNQRPPYPEISNSIAIGRDVLVYESNEVKIGNYQITSIKGAVPWSTYSDRRLKQNISTSTLGLAFISRLNPMSYTYVADKTNIRHDGLIAQDVEKVMHELGVDFSGLQKSSDGMYSLAYSDFVMPLINAVKEQQKEIEELKKQVQALIKAANKP